MKTTLDMLSDNEREALAHFFTGGAYPAFKKLLNIERTNIATRLLLVPANDVVNIAKHQGAAEKLKELHKILKENQKNRKDKD